MQSGLLYLLSLATCTVASLVPGWNYPSKKMSKDNLDSMKTFLDVVTHFHQKCMIDTMQKISNSYKMTDHLDDYNDRGAVKALNDEFEGGQMLAREMPFSILNPEHARQVEILFKVFYGAKNIDTFQKVSIWCRDNLNQLMFLYTFTVAVIWREDMKSITLPPPPEIYPHLFFSEATIMKAVEARENENANRGVPQEKKIVIDVEPRDALDDQYMALAYFTEDVGLGVSYQVSQFENPYWMSGDFVDRKGEVAWYFHEMLYRRYQWERASNGLPKRTFDLQEPLIPFDPQLVYKNGLMMPPRAAGSRLLPDDFPLMNTSLCMAGNMEELLANGLDAGNADHVGSLLTGSKSELSCGGYTGSYLYLLTNLVARVNDPGYDLPPGALEHFATMPRDPIFYGILGKVLGYMEEYKKSLPYYTVDDLTVPGVTITSVSVGQLETFMEDYYYDVTNAADVNRLEDDKVEIQARKRRLNHANFTTTFVVESEKDVKGMVRSFLCPRVDEEGRGMNDSRTQCIEIDRFPYSFKAGTNTVQRESWDSTVTAHDFPHNRALAKAVAEALKSSTGSSSEGLSPKRQCGHPHNLLLPRGTEEGLPASFFVAISTFDEAFLQSENDVKNFAGFVTCGSPANHKYPDSLPMGWPLDREIIDEEFWATPNFHATDVVITHKA